MNNLSDPSITFEKIKRIGRGSFGEVFKVRDVRNGATRAAKIISLDQIDDDYDDLCMEISVLANCNSKYITQYYGSSLEQDKLWLIMEYCSGGSCQDLIRCSDLVTGSSMKVLEEMHISVIIREVLYGLDYVHSQKRIHRDIKAANILLNENGEIKLCDFGVAAKITDTCMKRNTFVGTPYWMAPEVIKKDSYDYKADIWSTGIVCIELNDSVPPHSTMNPMRALFKITNEDPPTFKNPKASSKEFRDFLGKCLQKVPEQRMSITNLLKHKFINKYLRVKTNIFREMIPKVQEWNDRQNEDRDGGDGKSGQENGALVFDLDTVKSIFELDKTLDMEILNDEEEENIEENMDHGTVVVRRTPQKPDIQKHSLFNRNNSNNSSVKKVRGIEPKNAEIGFEPKLKNEPELKNASRNRSSSRERKNDQNRPKTDHRPKTDPPRPKTSDASPRKNKIEPEILRTRAKTNLEVKPVNSRTRRISDTTNQPPSNQPLPNQPSPHFSQKGPILQKPAKKRNNSEYEIPLPSITRNRFLKEDLSKRKSSSDSDNNCETIKEVKTASRTAIGAAHVTVPSHAAGVVSSSGSNLDILMHKTASKSTSKGEGKSSVIHSQSLDPSSFVQSPEYERPGETKTAFKNSENSKNFKNSINLKNSREFHTNGLEQVCHTNKNLQEENMEDNKQKHQNQANSHPTSANIKQNVQTQQSVQQHRGDGGDHVELAKISQEQQLIFLSRQAIGPSPHTKKLDQTAAQQNKRTASLDSNSLAAAPSLASDTEESDMAEPSSFSQELVKRTTSQNSDKNIEQLTENLGKSNLNENNNNKAATGKEGVPVQSMSGYAESFAKQLAEYSGEKAGVSKQNSGGGSGGGGNGGGSGGQASLNDKYGSKYADVHSGNQERRMENPSGVPAVESEYLRVLLVPLFTQLKERTYRQSRQQTAIDELRLAFEVAESRLPGMSDRLIDKIHSRMAEFSQPGASQITLQESIEEYGQETQYTNQIYNPYNPYSGNSFHR